jgi:hypothetical protein
MIIYLCGYVKCSVIYKGDGFRLNIYACYSWGMALNFGPDVSFDNMQDWKGIQAKAK